MKKYIFAAFVAVLSVTCFASYSFGIDEVQLNKLWALGHCPECDLRGANLTKVNLIKANLTEADLTGAKMIRANIVGAIFCNTKTPWGLDNSGCK